MNTGVYYFDGWSSETSHLSERLKTEFSTRKPVWGWLDNTKEIMEQQIDLAAESGFDFFAFDWYYPEVEEKKTPLNNSLELYLRATNKNKLKFCLLIANHGGYRIFKDDWQQVIQQWVALFSEDTYLLDNGKPVIIIFSPDDLTKCMGGSENVKKGFDSLRELAVEKGLPGVTIAGCLQDLPQCRIKISESVEIMKNEGYDYVTAYNYPINYYAEGNGRMIHAFKEMADYHKYFAWNFFASDANPLPYIPCVTCGFDKRPWEDAEDSKTFGWYYPDRTPEQVVSLISDANDWMSHHPQKTSKEKFVLMYAWNEMGEGGYILPTIEDNGRYLELIGNYLNDVKGIE